MKPVSVLIATGFVTLIVGSGLWVPRGSWAQAVPCVGDCDRDGAVTIDEILTGVNLALELLPISTCTSFDSNSDSVVSVDELITGVNNALAGCGAQGNHAPLASDVSFNADDTTTYLEKQLIGSDPDNDTISYELVAPATGTGYDFAYVNPESGVLYVTLAAAYRGMIVLPYRVTDGKRFSDPANATIQVQAGTPVYNGGSDDVDPKAYAGFPRAFYDGRLLGAPGASPTLPSAVDLSKDFPRPGDQGIQSSCVGWALGYALKSYQERVEIGWSLETPEHRFSPAYIYNQINGGRDQGAVFSDGLNLVVNQGVATLASMPYEEHDFLTQPSASAQQEASQFKGKSWKVANGILEIKDALANHLSVLVAIQIFDDLYLLKGPDSVYNTFGGANHGGHAVAAVGYDDRRYGGALKIINSWSQSWGDGGYFWLPYSAANHVVNTPGGQYPVFAAAAVLEDLPNPQAPPPDPVHPTPPAELPDLQVSNWKANFNGTPGGAGSLQYTITNTGPATAPAGAYVALLLSQDPTFRSSNTLVVYEPIPFEMPPGTTAFRDESNSIAFTFPADLLPGQYYMGLLADIWNDVVESNEDDNVSPATTLIEITNTLPDIEVVTWYSVWNAAGDGLLIYNIVNNGASTAPAGWLISLVLSPNDTIGDGDEIFLLGENASFAVEPGGTLFRDDSSAAPFSLYVDYFGNPVPPGTYYIALWLDPLDSLAESNETNNASLSWGTVGIAGGLGLDAGGVAPRLAGQASMLRPGEAYNGRKLAGDAGAMRKVQNSEIPGGGRRIEFLHAGTDSVRGQSRRQGESTGWPKVAQARQQVIFPVVMAKSMPKSD